MARVTAAKSLELEQFWRSHLEGWQRSELNQREYCEAHGLPLKRFGNWRAKLRDEMPVVRGSVLYRRGGTAKHMASHMSDRETGPVTPGYIPSVKSPVPRRRDFSLTEKRRIVAEACRPDATVTGVARRYGIGARLLFRWKQELAPSDKLETVFAEVKVGDSPDRSADAAGIGKKQQPGPDLAPVIIERSAPGIEVELVGGRRVRFAFGTDPKTVRSLVAALEGEAP